VLPLEFPAGQTAESLGLTGKETFSIPIGDGVKPRQTIEVSYVREDGTSGSFPAVVRIDTPVEVDYYRNGGILQTVLRSLL
jgi:aconitate hydratase